MLELVDLAIRLKLIMTRYHHRCMQFCSDVGPTPIFCVDAPKENQCYFIARCGGGVPALAWKYMQRKGVVTGGDVNSEQVREYPMLAS